MLRGYRWRGRDPLVCLDQVGNANDDVLDLTPVSDAPAQHVRDGWEPWFSGQAVPLIWERVEPDEVEPCRTQ
jgi:hypothetical protein